MYKKYMKRMLDIILSLVAIIVLSPLLLILYITVRINLGSPVIFRQQRVGKDEKLFYICKFRTMTDKKDENGEYLPDNERITKFGRFLRSSSLDELPGLFDILTGKLSVIGPRSLLVSYLPYYTERERKRHSVRGGLVPPEVLYNNVQPTWEQQFEYEVYYVENLSFWLDVKILFVTMRSVLKRGSIDYGGYVRQSLIEERKEKAGASVGEEK